MWDSSSCRGRKVSDVESLLCPNYILYLKSLGFNKKGFQVVAEIRFFFRALIREVVKDQMTAQEACLNQEKDEMKVKRVNTVVNW